MGSGDQPGGAGAGVWQRRALALFSLGVASAKHCGLARVAAVAPGLALAPSITRRFERFLANPRLDVRAARSAVGAAVLEQGRGQTLWLALDETHQGKTATAPPSSPSLTPSPSPSLDHRSVGKSAHPSNVRRRAASQPGKASLRSERTPQALAVRS